MATAMTRVVPLTNKTDWLARRKTGIGASEAAAVLDLHPYLSRMDLYAQKLGLLEGPDETEAMYWGKKLEPQLAEAYEERTGRRVFDPGPYMIGVSMAHPMLIATPDLLTDDPVRGQGLVELKCVNRYKADEWQDDPPVAYQIQLQHQLYVTQKTWGSLAVLIGGNQFKWFDLERSDVFLAEYIKHAVAFWGHVERREPPPVDRASLDTVKALFKDVAPRSIDLPADALDWDRQIEEGTRMEREGKALAEDGKARLLLAMGDAELGLIGNIQYRRKQIDVKAEAKPREAHSYVKLLRSLIGGRR
jgi:putative phage-type endonuclease